MIDLTDIHIELLKVYWWLIPLLLTITIIRTPWFKGLIGEWLVNLVAKITLPAKTYTRFHNVTLKTNDGTTQIDHIIVSRYGVFCIETKNMAGWIFGNEQDEQWTQTIYRNSYKFQNPLRQNYKHVKTLESLLSLQDNPVYSIVVFNGGATIKTPMPENVTYTLGFPRYIKSYKKHIFTGTEIAHFCKMISLNRMEPTWRTDRIHRRNVKKLITAKSNKKSKINHSKKKQSRLGKIVIGIMIIFIITRPQFREFVGNYLMSNIQTVQQTINPG